MTDSTPFHFPRPGAALIQEARAARQAAQLNEEEEWVKAHVCAILSRLKARASDWKSDSRGFGLVRSVIHCLEREVDHGSLLFGRPSGAGG